MRHEGRLSEWNSDRGFGFIAPAAGGRRVFVHVSAFPRGSRPLLGDALSYVEGRDQTNRVQATDVQLMATERGRRRTSPGLSRAVAVSGVFFVLLLGLVLTDRAAAWILLTYAGLSVLALVLYRADKSAAQRGAWRIPESNLHLVSLLGGWPGALVAQQALRHKTRKQPFRTVFWGTVVVNCAVLVFVVTQGTALLG